MGPTVISSPLWLNCAFIYYETVIGSWRWCNNGLETYSQNCVRGLWKNTSNQNNRNNPKIIGIFKDPTLCLTQEVTLMQNWKQELQIYISVKVNFLFGSTVTLNNFGGQNGYRDHVQNLTLCLGETIYPSSQKKLSIHHLKKSWFDCQ